MSSSESSSENSDTDDFFDDILNGSVSNGFAFEPEYPASEVDARLLASQENKSSDDDTDEHDEGDDHWCSCENCVHMEVAMENVCCRSFSDTIGNKFGIQKCSILTAAFRDVCLNTNVLE